MISFGRPLALLGLAGLWLLWRWHRRARPAGDTPFSAFFLLDGGGDPAQAGPRLRARGLLAVRALSWTLLVLALAGPEWRGPAGTLILTDGPVRPDPAWARPWVFIRAGQPPAEIEGDPEAIPPVAAPPDWGGALLLGRRRAPDAQLVRWRAPEAGGLVGAGAALDDGALVITAAARGGAPVLHQGDRRWPLERRVGDWALRPPPGLQPGPATVQLGPVGWPLCVPDPGPVTAAAEGWPPAVDAVLEALELPRRPAAEADWRPGPGGPRRSGWAAFAPPVTRLWFAPPEAAAQGPAPLWFPEGLPPPGAEVRRWRPLEGPGAPLLFAGDRIVADGGAGVLGHDLRFGFDPADSDLPETAGWPVLFADLLAEERWRRARCRIHEAGRSVVIQSQDPVTVEAPDKTSRRLAPGGGLVVLDGLDQQGHYRLRAGGVTAWLAVVPPPRQPEAPRAEGAGEAQVLAAAPRAPDRGPWLAGLACLGLAGVLFGWRRRSGFAFAALVGAGAAAAGLELGGGPPGQVVVAVDTSGSMPEAETRAAQAALLAGLGPAAGGWVAGDGAVAGAGEDPAALPWGAGATRHGPLVAAAATLAGPGGAVVLLTDGRALDGPVAAPLPVFPLAVQGTGPDGLIESARAVRIGERIFARIQARADRPVAGRLHVGGLEVPVQLDREGRGLRASLPAEGDHLALRLAIPGDRLAANDALVLPVEAHASRRALVVGPGAGWVTAAGLEAEQVPAAGLGEAGRRLGELAAVILVDQPLEALDPALLPRLRRWVEAGGLLLLAGRSQAFGPGGWAGSPLDALSPLQADPRPPGIDRLAVALALDRSGSMAREAGGIGAEGVGRLARALAAGLGEADHLAILGFATDSEVILPLTDRARALATDLPVPALARGGTRLGPVIRQAAALLGGAGVDAPVLVLIGDGDFSDGDSPEVVAGAIEALRAVGARLVAVQVGPAPAEEPTRRLVAALDGVRVRARPDEIPRLALSGVLGAGRGGLVVPGGTVHPGDGWAARIGGSPPPVAGRVRVAARSEARILARAGGDPFLAEWSVGQGRVIALATEAWALDAAQWSSLLAPAVAPRPREAQITVGGGWLRYRGAPGDPPPTGPAVIRGASGPQEVVWQPTGPGEAVAPLPPGPPEILEIATPTARGALVERVARPVPDELRATGLAPDALAAQAALTGGQVLADPQATGPVLAARRPRRGLPGHLLLAPLALGLLLGDTRRWARGR